MEPLSNLLKFKFLYIFVMATILLSTDAIFFNDDESFEYPEAIESIPPLEPTNGNPYGFPTPLSPPPLTSPAAIPPPATPSLVMPPPPPSPNSPIKSPPGKPSSPPTAAPGPRLPSPMGHPQPPPATPPLMAPPPPLSPNFPIKSPPGKPTIPPSASPGPPPPQKKPQNAVWCVAKPTVPDLVIQAALDYACGSGADCKPIQPNGPCFQPNTLVAHASYAFNSYWQSKKAAGGTCDFGGTAMLVSIDPSYDKCSFTDK